jgi:hypothetical protein
MKRFGGLVATACILAFATCASGCQQPDQGGGRSLMTEALKGVWRPVRLMADRAPIADQLTLEIDARAGRVSGFAGCGRFTAKWNGYGLWASLSEFTPEVASCPSIAHTQAQQIYLGTLAATERYTVQSGPDGDQLLLFTKGDNPPSVFVRADR